MGHSSYPRDHKGGEREKRREERREERGEERRGEERRGEERRGEKRRVEERRGEERREEERRGEERRGEERRGEERRPAKCRLRESSQSRAALSREPSWFMSRVVMDSCHLRHVDSLTPILVLAVTETGRRGWLSDRLIG
jgi:hypothetical protein